MYALLKPDGTFYRVVNDNLPGGSTDYAAYGVLPVNNVIPEGYSRTGWQIVNGVVEPVLIETPPSPVPFEVGSGQIRAALVAAGWVTITNPSNPDPEIDTWVSAMLEAAVPDTGQKTIAYLLWHNASSFKRNNQFIALVSALTGKTQQQTDDLFRLAATF